MAANDDQQRPLINRASYRSPANRGRLLRGHDPRVALLDPDRRIPDLLLERLALLRALGGPDPGLDHHVADHPRGDVRRRGGFVGLVLEEIRDVPLLVEGPPLVVNESAVVIEQLPQLVLVAVLECRVVCLQLFGDLILHLELICIHRPER